MFWSKKMNLDNNERDTILSALTESLPILRKKLDLRQQDLAITL